MISRHWKGTVKPGREGDYLQHLRTDTFPQLARIHGFVRASILRRAVSSGTEFQIVTLWESLEAIQAFAGDHAEVAVVPPAAQQMMTTYDFHVAHYEVVQDYEPR